MAPNIRSLRRSDRRGRHRTHGAREATCPGTEIRSHRPTGRGIAHDFNNMIGAIIGWADMGVEETAAGLTPSPPFRKGTAPGQPRRRAYAAVAGFRPPPDSGTTQYRLESAPSIETLSLLEKVIGSNIEIKANLAPDLSARARRSRASGASADESLHQCARRHARRRRALHRHHQRHVDENFARSSRSRTPANT